MASKVRLYVDAPLGAGQAVALSREAAHHLITVMRRQVGDPVLVFNGADGEWQASIAEAGKKGALIVCDSQTRGQVASPDIWLLFAPIKKARLDVLIEKAVELGVGRLCPVLTERTQSERWRADRIRAQIREAAEQCERLDLPLLDAPRKLPAVLSDWPSDRVLFAAMERQGPGGGFSVPGRAALLIGPEGGFSPAEAALIAGHSAVRAVALGPRILRAETAAIAALSLWQAAQGDWHEN